MKQPSGQSRGEPVGHTGPNAGCTSPVKRPFGGLHTSLVQAAAAGPEKGPARPAMAERGKEEGPGEEPARARDSP